MIPPYVQEMAREFDRCIAMRELTWAEQLKKHWEQYRSQADLHAVPVLSMEVITLGMEREDFDIEFHRVTYGSRVVIEVDGVVVETLCGGQ